MVKPQELKYQFSDYLGWYTWNFEFHDIDFDVAKFDFGDTEIKIMDDIPDFPRLNLDFPILKSWKMDALMNSNTAFIPEGTRMDIEFKEFDIGGSIGLTVD